MASATPSISSDSPVISNWSVADPVKGSDLACAPRTAAAVTTTSARPGVALFGGVCGRSKASGRTPTGVMTGVVMAPVAVLWWLTDASQVAGPGCPDAVDKAAGG